jgi:hypothetical protein
LENLRNRERKKDRKKLQPIEGEAIPAPYKLGSPDPAHSQYTYYITIIIVNIVTTQINSTNNLVELHNWSLTTPPRGVIDK